MWIDDGPVSSIATVPTGRHAVDFVRLGALSVKAAASGTLRFDEFRSGRVVRIGP
jgi:hypothetical protein